MSDETTSGSQTFESQTPELQTPELQTSESQTPESQTSVIEDVGQPVTGVSFCPDLGIYHMHHEASGNDDPKDIKLTRSELHDLVDGLLKSGKALQAQQLAVMCAWARLFAHKVVVFYDTGVFRIFNPVPPDEKEAEESADMKQFFAAWEKEHPGGKGIPTVASCQSTR